MSLRFSDIIYPRFLVLLFFSFSISSFVSAQTPLVTGQVNKYAKVTAVGLDNVTVQDASDFTVGDTVMVMQMGGVEINASATLPGNFQNYLGYPGSYEMVIVSAVNTGSGQVTFSRNLLRAYDPLGKIQLIRVKSVSNAVVNSELTCAKWDSATVKGGVLAFIVKGVLTLNANINVSGKGFTGGKVAPGSGFCQELNDSLHSYFYNIWSSVSGYKGEGLGFRNATGVPVYPSLARGKGVTLTGGGGGNGHYSGGGGGSNYGAGSSGDVEVTGCSFQYLGGNGGYSLSSTPISGGVFFGGGGGASVYSGTPSTSAGGSGGGIVIILADSIAGNGRIISANGAEPNGNTVVGTGAGGGGGGAGSVIISTRYFKTNPVINANGGKGGNTVNSAGAGGGGGGGLIWTKAAFPGTATSSGGLSGLNNGVNPNRNGSPGVVLINLNLPLNGFLFNAIYSTVTQNQTDSICQGLVPPVLAGTLPTGGIGGYTYQWQRSYDEIGWSDVTGTEVNFTPTQAETDTVWFRRIVRDGAGIEDISKSVKIIVHQIISDNLIDGDTTICYNQNPEELYPSNSGPQGGNGIYFYSWEKSNNSVLWSLADGTISQAEYDPPALTATQYYHRIVNSGACTNTSAHVTVNVLPSITANTILADQTICQSSNFSNLTGSAPSGGTSSFTYLWKSSSDNITWEPADAPNTSINYDPQDDSPDIYYYKRIVYSGLNMTCQDTSNYVTLTCHPMITGNVILDNQTICEGSSPATINGDVPGGGAGPGTFTYQWQNSTNGSTFNVMPDITTEDLTGTPLTATTWYQRTAYSSVCSDTSDDIKITVDPAITDYQINLAALAHDTLATGQIPGLLQGTPAGGLGAFTFGWEASTDNTNFSGLPAAGETYQSGALNATTWFRRTVTSGECSVTSTFKITILPVLAGNTIASDQRVCNDVPPAMVTGSTPTGGDGKYRYLWEKKDTESPDWVTAGGISNTINYQPPVLGENTQYRRQAFSGENNCCTSVSPVVTVTVDTMPLNISAGANRELLPFELAVNLDGNFEGTGTCEWSFSPVSGEGDIPIIADPADMKTAVTKLNFGDNVFEFTVNNGECNAGPFNVTITVPEIMIPQGISPDDDGSNDYFDVKGLQFTHNELVIINTGGAVVFRMQDYQSDDPDLAWKGLDNYGDPLPDGTYYFLLTIKGSTDPDVPAFTTHLSGFIIIRR